MFSYGVDFLGQIGIWPEVRRITAISKIAKDLKNGDVFFEPIYRYIEGSSAEELSWGKMGELK